MRAGIGASQRRLYILVEPGDISADAIAAIKVLGSMKATNIVTRVAPTVSPGQNLPPPSPCSIGRIFCHLVTGTGLYNPLSLHGK